MRRQELKVGLNLNNENTGSGTESGENLEHYSAFDPQTTFKLSVHTHDIRTI